MLASRYAEDQPGESLSSWDDWVTAQKSTGWLVQRIQEFTRHTFNICCYIFLYIDVSILYRTCIKMQEQES